MAVSDITIAPASIFVGGTAPADGTWMTIDANGIPQSAVGTSMAAVNVGMTGAAATFGLTRKLKEVYTQQHLAPVMALAVSEEIALTFTVSELIMTNIQKFMSGTSITDNVGTTPKYRGVSGGDTATVAATPFAMVAKDPATGYYRGYLLYLGYVADKVEVAFDNQKEVMVKVTVKALVDLSRTSDVTGNLYQVVEQHL